jgi:hypothetical protein
MTTFTAPDAPTDAPTRHIVTLQALRAAPARAAELAAGLPEAACLWRPPGGGWSMHQVVAHLAAGEPHFLGRLRRMAAEDNAFLPYFGSDVARPESNEPMPALLERFRQEREAALRFLATLAADDWDRPGVHETLGPTTLAGQVQNIASHDAEHLSELYALRAASEAGVHG